MAVDASFLLEFFQVCAVKKNKATTNIISSRLSRLDNLGRNDVAHNAILRDITLVENQIPLFVLRKVLEMYFSSCDDADDMLFSWFVGVCEELSPFKKVVHDQKIDIKECPHFLDFVYHFVVPKMVEKNVLNEIAGGDHPNEDTQDGSKHQDGAGCIHTLQVKLSSLDGVIKFTKKVIFSKPVKKIVKLPWAIISKLPVISNIKEPLEHFFNSINEDEDANDEESGSNGLNSRSPLLEEIEIPSVTRLVKAGIKFQRTREGISSISFDIKTRTFKLPVIRLDVNSGIVLRNLVAYEVCHASGPLVLARYIELMNGIIDTEEDAKFLREIGIIVNRMNSDEEVAELWNGMSKSIRLTKVPFLDKVIEDVNKDYDRRWKVKFEKTMKRYVFGSWKILTLLGAIMMLLLLGLQAFCSVYECARIVPIGPVQELN